MALESTNRTVRIVSVIFFISVLIAGAKVSTTIAAGTPPQDKNAELLLRICCDTVAKNATAYAESYKEAVLSMEDDVRKRQFATAVRGGNGNGSGDDEIIYVLFQCMGDLGNNDCSQCFRNITNIMYGCFPATGGRIVYWGCYMRTENYDFFAIPVEPGDYRLSKCGDEKSKDPKFAVVGKKKLRELVKVAKAKGVACVYKKTRTFFFLSIAVCWKSLTNESCVRCIDDAFERCIRCFPYTECRLLNSGCAMRYADYDFSNNSEERLAKEIMYIYMCYVFGGLAVSALILAGGIYWSRANYKRRRRQRNANHGVKRVQIKFKSTEKGLNFLEFNHVTLDKATESFADSHRLGQGGYGEVFKGTLPDGREIAIKRLFATSGKSQCEEICNEIDIISRAQHKNLVRFLGCCFTTTDSFLVYEFLVNKSLDRILFDSAKKRELDWRKRWQIILGTAEGLEYLHKGCQLRIIHRDIKASNVLLDAKWKPKIADFGLARFSLCGQNISSATIAGTFGYLAPEYLAQGRLTEKVDVYSFGVLLLEIVSGVRNNKLWSDSSFETLVTYVWKKFQADTVSEIIEKELNAKENYIEKEVKRVVQIGLLCTQESPDLRPNMTMVLEMLKQDNELELPIPTQPPFIDEHLEFSSSLGSFRWQPSLGFNKL